MFFASNFHVSSGGYVCYTLRWVLIFSINRQTAEGENNHYSLKVMSKDPIIGIKSIDNVR
jgi:hypothetical protein